MLNKIIIKSMGNRVLALNAAKKYRDTINSKEPRQKKENSIALFVFRPLIFLIGILLVLLYFIFLLVNIIYLLHVYFKNRYSISYAEYIPSWEKLYKYWSSYPSCFITKATEYTYYHGLSKNVFYNSLEIGVYTGETSRSFFNNRKFVVGIEYNIKRLLKYIQGEIIHSHLYSADVSNLPFEDEIFHNIICVHSIDDMEISASIALKEMGRVLKQGGLLVFSGMTENFSRHNLLVRILRGIRMKKLGNIIFENIYIGSHNLYNKKEWERILDMSGFEVISYQTYVPFNYSGFFDFSYRPEVIILIIVGWKNLLTHLVRISMIRRILYRSAAAMTYLSRTKTTEVEGINFFCIAKKKKLREAYPNDTVFSNTESLICPKCRENVSPVHEIDEVKIKKYACSSCKNEYPVVEGIPLFIVLDELDEKTETKRSQSIFQT